MRRSCCVGFCRGRPYHGGGKRRDCFIGSRESMRPQEVIGRSLQDKTLVSFGLCTRAIPSCLVAQLNLRRDSFWPASAYPIISPSGIPSATILFRILHPILALLRNSIYAETASGPPRLIRSSRHRASRAQPSCLESCTRSSPPLFVIPTASNASQSPGPSCTDRRLSPPWSACYSPIRFATSAFRRGPALRCYGWARGWLQTVEHGGLPFVVVSALWGNDRRDGSRAFRRQRWRHTPCRLERRRLNDRPVVQGKRTRSGSRARLLVSLQDTTSPLCSSTHRCSFR